ncbi:MAG: hypothetical protein ACI8RZ_000305 [Myxococcota bacterium]|jgi:hypothetical protein
MKIMVFGTLLCLAGCNNKEPTDDVGSTDDTSPTIIDDDGDGFALEVDCDDTDAAINPDASEVCDGIDNDCDGSIDDDDDSLDITTASEWLTDADADGYGSLKATVQACTQPSGTVTEAGDCDDTDAAISPDAVEVCDSIDNDCDGLIDDADDSIDASTQTAHFPDADGDGYGDSADGGMLFCDSSPEIGVLIPDNTDCDDTSTAINPAAPESCDGIDNDCDTNLDNNAGAVFTNDTGSITDLGSIFRSGTVSTSMLWVSPEGGTLSICEGTWHTRLKLDHDISVVGAGAASTILDGSLSGSVILARTAGTEIAVEGVTLTNGSGSPGAYTIIDGGGGIDCGAELNLSLTDMVSTAHATDLGGGLLVYGGCEVDVEGSEFTDSYGLWGMGVGIMEGSAVINNSVISGNQTNGFGAGIYLGLLGSVYLELNDTLVENNDTFSNGGGLAINNSKGTVEVLCTGSSKTSAGFLNNTSLYDGGGVFLNSSSATFESVDCDFGKSNSPDDVFDANGDAYSYGNDASFICDSTGCN